MRIKTFLAAYILFLGILFVSIGIVSAHMTRSTTSMLREKAAREFQSITTSLAREMAEIFARFPGGQEYQTLTNNVFGRFVHYYRQHNIGLSLSRITPGTGPGAIISFERDNNGHFISITGRLPYPFNYYRLDYSLDITANIEDMQGIQQYLWITSIIVSVVAAVLLYIILTRIFKPLGIVASAAQQIADGQYGRRITVKGQNELSAVAVAFNRMSEEIERQIYLLENEAERKQQFVNNFAHEIRTPLTSIYGYAEYLQKASLTEGELIESAGYIMSEANHMKNVANSLLELATLRDYKPQIGPISIPELFAEIKQGLEKTLSQHDAVLQIEFQTGLQTELQAELQTGLQTGLQAELHTEFHIQAPGPYIEGQRDLIKSLVINICNNAIASTEQGKGIIRLNATIEGKNTVISIDDNGCGIHSSQLSKITEPFFQVDRARSRENSGVGLGLALCKQIVEVHGAKMTIDSIPDIGTMVRLIFTTP